jgi:hypothetical protein
MQQPQLHQQGSGLGKVAAWAALDLLEHLAWMRTVDTWAMDKSNFMVRAGDNGRPAGTTAPTGMRLLQQPLQVQHHQLRLPTLGWAWHYQEQRLHAERIAKEIEEESKDAQDQAVATHLIPIFPWTLV